MKTPPGVCLVLCALAIPLGGCAAGNMQDGARTHLSETQCRDLTAIADHAPVTHERNISELAALEEAGYRPAFAFDPYYPQDLQIAQRRVDGWYRTECQQASPG